MNKFLLLILLFSNISKIFCKKNGWEILKNRGGYFRRLKETNFVLTVFLKEKNSPLIKKLKEIENLDIIKKNDVDMLIIYHNEIPFFKEHYDLISNKNYMKFYLRSKSYDLENLDDKILKHFNNHLTQFLKDKINLITTNINNFSELLDNLKSKKIIALYLGKDNYNFQNFFHLAISYIDFDFYYSFDNKIKLKLLEKFGKGIKKLHDDLFLILRDIDLIDNFDENELIIFDFDKNSTKNLFEFFNFEQHPKLGNCNFAKNNIKNLYRKKEKMLIYFRLPNKEIDIQTDRFYKIIKSIPKKMIFSECYLDDEENMNILQQYFIRENVQIEADTLYSLYVTQNHELIIRLIVEGMEMENIGQLFDNGINAKFKIDTINSHYGDL